MTQFVAQQQTHPLLSSRRTETFTRGNQCSTFDPLATSSVASASSPKHTPRSSFVRITGSFVLELYCCCCCCCGSTITQTMLPFVLSDGRSFVLLPRSQQSTYIFPFTPGITEWPPNVVFPCAPSPPPGPPRLGEQNISFTATKSAMEKATNYVDRSLIK